MGVVGGVQDQDAVVAALVERPTEVRAGSGGIDLLPLGPAHVGDEELAGLVEVHREGIAQAQLPDLGLVVGEVGARLDEGIVR